MPPKSKKQNKSKKSDKSKKQNITKIVIPKEFRVKKSQCRAMTNERGLLSQLPALSQTVSAQHFSLICMLNGNKPISQYSSNAYFYCPNRLMNNLKTQILAETMKVKTLVYHKDKSVNQIMICYLDQAEEERAYICAYLGKQIYFETGAEKQRKMLSFHQPYNYIFGKLYGYSDAEIRGYYLQKYLLVSLPPKIKSKMMKYISNSNFDLDIVSFKTKLERLYNALNKTDGFKDFDEKFKTIISSSLPILEKIKKDPKFKAFVRNTKPKPFKFDMKEFKEMYPDDYDKYEPKIIKFQKSLTKK